MLSLESRLRLSAELFKRTSRQMAGKRRSAFNAFTYGIADGWCFAVMTEALERKVREPARLTQSAEKQLLIANRVWTHGQEKLMKKSRMNLTERVAAGWGKRVMRYQHTINRSESLANDVRTGNAFLSGITAD
jgi:hypothetical protein